MGDLGAISQCELVCTGLCVGVTVRFVPGHEAAGLVAQSFDVVSLEVFLRKNFNSCDVRAVSVT